VRVKEKCSLSSVRGVWDERREGGGATNELLNTGAPWQSGGGKVPTQALRRRHWFWAFRLVFVRETCPARPQNKQTTKKKSRATSSDQRSRTIQSQFLLHQGRCTPHESLLPPCCTPTIVKNTLPPCKPFESCETHARKHAVRSGP